MPLEGNAMRLKLLQRSLGCIWRRLTPRILAEGFTLEIPRDLGVGNQKPGAGSRFTTSELASQVRVRASPLIASSRKDGEKAQLAHEFCRDAGCPQMLTWVHDDPATEPLHHARSADRSGNDTRQKGSQASPASAAGNSGLDDRKRDGARARL